MTWIDANCQLAESKPTDTKKLIRWLYISLEIFSLLHLE
jgi:hypothetical protein